MPGCEGGSKLFSRSCRDPAPAWVGAAISIIWATKLQCWVGPYQRTPQDRAAHNQMMISPGMVAACLCAGTRRLECTPEVGERECRDFILDTQLDRRIVEGVHCLADL